MVIIIVLGLFFLGILIGYIIKNLKLVSKISGTTSIVLVCMLLLLLGISVGSNNIIMQNLTDIGLKALLITFFTLGFSVFGSYVVYMAFFKNK
jgi:hypothetical protein